MSTTESSSDADRSGRPPCLPELESGRPGRLPLHRPSRLWLWFVAAFALQFAVWAAWLTFASHHTVSEVPLATGR